MGDGEAQVVASDSIAYVRRRLSRTLTVTATTIALGPFALVATAAVRADEALANLAHDVLGPTAAAAGIIALAALALRAFPFASPGRLTRRGASLTVDFPTRMVRKNHVALPAVLSGYLVPAGVRTRAELELANGDVVEVDVAEFATAVEVLRVAGVDAARQHARFRVDDAVSRAFAFMLVACVVGLVASPLMPTLAAGAAGVAGAALWAAAVLAVTWTAKDFVTLPEITVGTDGIAYKRGPFRRFIPLRDIKEVRSSGVTLYIHLRDGRVKKLQSLTGADPGRAYSLELRVREALAASAGEHTSAQLEQLERRGKSVADWTVALAGLTRAGSSYRASGLTAEDLDAIVASPDVTPERRIGAALALRSAGHPAAGERIRVAAAQCASSRLRIALERVGDGAVDLTAITEALAETEAEPKKKARA